MSSSKNRTTSNKNLSPGIDTLNDNDNHCYVNLNQTQSGQRRTFTDSDSNNAKNLPIKPLTINNVNKFSPSKNNLNNSSISDPKPPKNWYSPPSSVKSDSRPPSMVGMKTPTHRGLSKLQTIDENSRNLPIPKVLELCVNSNIEIQLNALAYLQHLTFNNNNIKMEVKNSGKLPNIIELTRSQKSNVACAALNVLKNMSFSETEVIITDIERLSGIQRMVSIIENNNDISQKELAIDILWNLSVHYVLKNIILTETVPTLVQYIILPECNLVKGANGNYIPSEAINWSIILRNCLGIISNISYESQEARVKLRDQDLLIDCILYLISMAQNVEETGESIGKNLVEKELLDSKIIENCTCILRNLTYAIQEVLDPNYLLNRPNSSPKLKTSNKGKRNKPNVLSPPINDNPKGVELLWNTRYIVETINPILKFGANAITLEAAAGIIQNLSAGDWEPSKELRTEFRVQLALPSLIELIDISPDEVIRSAATALRNLVQDEKTCMLIGSNGLHVLTGKIPMHSKSKKISNTALAAVLSTIYAVIKNQDEFMKEFIMEKGAQRCIYVRDSEDFIAYQDQFPDKIAQFSKQILELLWKTPAARDLLKKKNYKQSEIMPTRNLDPCNMCGPSISTKPKSINVDKDSFDLDSSHQSLNNYPENKTFTRDSCTSMMSNIALQQRNSRAFTTNTVPGYGQVKVPNNFNSQSNRPKEIPRKDNQFTSINTISEKSDNQSRAQLNINNNFNPKLKNNTDELDNYFQSPRALGSVNSYSNNSFSGSQNDVSNNWSNRNPIKSYNRPPPNIPNQRESEASNNSNAYKYEYSIPTKQNKSPNTLDKQNKVDSWV